MKCGVVGNPAYDVVHVQGSDGDRLGPDYNMDNNPLYEMRIMSNERHSHKTGTPDRPHVYETVDTVAVLGKQERRGKCLLSSSSFVLHSHSLHMSLKPCFSCM